MRLCVWNRVRICWSFFTFMCVCVSRFWFSQPASGWFRCSLVSFVLIKKKISRVKRFGFVRFFSLHSEIATEKIRNQDLYPNINECEMLCVCFWWAPLYRIWAETQKCSHGIFYWMRKYHCLTVWFGETAKWNVSWFVWCCRATRVPFFVFVQNPFLVRVCNTRTQLTINSNSHQ